METSGKIKILTVDSSSFTGSVALCHGEVLIAESLLNVRSTHSEKLLKQIDLLLDAANWTLEDLDLLAVVTGPGSFTGLRIGIATVKGLAEVLNKPVVPVSALQTIAMNLPLSPVPICAFLDARKQEVYSQLFSWRASEGPVAIGNPSVLPPETLLLQLPGEVALVGDGVPIYRHLIDTHLADRAFIPVATAHQLRAAQASWLALQAWRSGLAQSAADILPVYIRPSDAELNLSRKGGI
ncbi:tRNA threonylcarbamoyladenosine biosynthesis protein TsaB [Desulfuromusa kysingii]|uniref:tRNA threonylcarbamoyladenosine biosynthesis protein TsaB n=1 Tax=Desulfuromusa kysingii TaxID=37625 RepID=A0A1H3Y7Y8_9BACT|nr:tRNA (adenosine(37)-N6)-threonylcarbamoyltransferase complex dimerization subunit type 1 TsaB [Desulfuromusa kysingii]SEA07725.1 tRNA threonylcarbamoyladenosine biosynthesis protein TsaB [Desulfuromusa kysingii]